MPVKVNSFISVKKPLERNRHNRILHYVMKKLSSTPLDPLVAPREYFDTAVISYYREK